MVNREKEGKKGRLLDLGGLVVDLSGLHDDQEREVIGDLLEGISAGQAHGLDVVRELRRVSGLGVTAIYEREDMSDVEINLATFYLAYGFRKLCQEMGIGPAIEEVIIIDS